MNIGRWLNWKPKEANSGESALSEPTKPTKPGFDGFEGRVSGEMAEIAPLDEVLKGQAVELYVADGNCLFIVADEEDARRLGEPRGAVYTAAEVRRVLQIQDPDIVLEIHAWKRAFNGRVREIQKHERGRRPGADAAGHGSGGCA
jgi:hypothetical protein